MPQTLKDAFFWECFGIGLSGKDAGAYEAIRVLFGAIPFSEWNERISFRSFCPR